MLAAHVPPLDRLVDAHPWWTVVAVVVALVSLWRWMQWKARYDLQPLCEELGFVFGAGWLGASQVRGEVAGRNVTVVLRHDRIRGSRGTYPYTLVTVDSRADAGVRFVVRRKSLLGWGAPFPLRLDDVDVQEATTGDPDFDEKWWICADSSAVARLQDLFGAEEKQSLAMLASGSADLAYDGQRVSLKIARRRWRSNRDAIRRAVDAAVLIEQRLQGAMPGGH